jgi:hypothetical protein
MQCWICKWAPKTNFSVISLAVYKYNTYHIRVGETHCLWGSYESGDILIVQIEVALCCSVRLFHGGSSNSYHVKGVSLETLGIGSVMGQGFFFFFYNGYTTVVRGEALVFWLCTGVCQSASSGRGRGRNYSACSVVLKPSLISSTWSNKRWGWPMDRNWIVIMAAGICFVHL